MPKLNLSKKTALIILVAIVLGLPLLGLLSSLTSRSSLSQPLDTSFSTSSAPGFRDMAQNAAGQAEVMMYDEEAKMDAPMAGAGFAGTDSIASMPIQPPIYYDEGFTPGVDRTIVKNADISLIVDDTRQAANRVTDIVNAAQGTVTNTSVYEAKPDSGRVYANMTIRVPVDSVESIMSALRDVGTRVVSENISALDRTEQKIDLEAQLGNLRATETQLLSIMTHAETVEETLKVQVELSNVRGQIERMQAQLDNLLGDAAMSTIHVSLSTEVSELPIVDPSNRSLLQEIRLALRDAANLYRNLFIHGLRLAIIVGPILIIGGIGFWVFKRFKR